MALFSVNQNVQWFTAKAYDSNLDTIGDIVINSNNTTTKSAASKIWFKYLSGKGPKRSEIIEKGNGGYITVTPAASMKVVPGAIKFTMNTGVNSGNPVVGQTYRININVPNYHAIGDRNIGEFGANAIAKTAVASDLLADLAVDLFRNSEGLYKVIVSDEDESDASYVEVTSESSVTGETIASITIIANEQDWLQGTMQRENVRFEVSFNTITYSGVEYTNWCINTVVVDPKDASGNSIFFTNSKDIADMEWFYLGEHGDQQRMVGYPNVVMHDGNYYLVDPTNAYGYDLVRIHHAYVGSNHAVQKSEKDILIAVPLAGANTHTATLALLQAMDDYFTGMGTISAMPSVPTTYTF